MRHRITAGLLFLVSFLAACGRVTGLYELAPGESLEANQHLVVVDAQLSAGSTVEGDLNITAASNVTVESHIKGDLTVFAKNLTLGSPALIEGDLVYCLVSNGQFTQTDDAVIWGEIRNNCNDASHRAELLDDDMSPGWQLVTNIILSLAAGLLAALTTIFLPKQLSRITLAAQEQRVKAFSLGALTLVVVVGLSSLWGLSLQVIVPVLLIPIVAVIWIGIICLMFLGTIALAQSFGVWLTNVLRRHNQPPVLTAMLGAMTLTFLSLSFQLFSPLAFLTAVSSLVILAWALGSALMTRAGTRPYKRP